MNRARVRTLAIGVSGLVIALSGSTSASAGKPSTAQRSTVDLGYWEQWVVDQQVRFIYNPDDFLAGGDPAYVGVRRVADGQPGVDFEKSAFLQPDAGLRKQHVAPEGEGFSVTIPKGLPTGDYAYRIEFACGPSDPQKTCANGIFHVPVRNDDDQPLLVKPGSGPFHIPVLLGSHEFQIELTARKPIYGVRLEPGMHSAAGIHSFELVRPGSSSGTGAAVNEPIKVIGPGRPFHGVVRVNRASGVAPAWNYLAADWRRSFPELPLTFTYKDAHEREWRSHSAPIKFEYQLPPGGVVIYYALLLVVATLAGAIGRLAAGFAVGNWTSEARTWARSMLLAGMLCVIGLVLGAKIEPVGLFQLDLTNLRGILAIGVIAGLVPEIIRGRLKALFPERPAPDAAPIDLTERAAGRRTVSRVAQSPGRATGDAPSDRPTDQPPVDKEQVAS
jgi:hypothetical protein